ncbi:hypothetical protein ET475_15200 [Microbacterium protaetiae]|uniref:Site-specific recombinase n=1 Tax=Microbacterium protaetiae TaxID=2509458 RepID=A0A4P6EI25_9MICO|nr:hypothetical protein [Microbacterium protaetiae]QAY61193.1 hypothetical protein ET475_15200 [Microbacterium protaetiae]
MAKIRVRWPEGNICGICFTDATHTYGTCRGCGEEDRMLPGRDEMAWAICRTCAGIETNLECDACGREAERFRGGVCIRCVVRTDLNDLVSPGADLRLRRLVDLLADVARPESIYSYMRGKRAHALLAAIGTRELPLTQEAFDGLEPGHAVEHLRALLVHHHMLPERGTDERLHRFEQWIKARLATLPDDGTRDRIERFATWHHLRRVRDRAVEERANLETVTHAAKQEITEAGKFLLWLRAEHHIGTEDLRQHHVDEYLASGTSTRKHIRNFARWINRDEGRHRKADRIDAPFRTARSEPMLRQSERIELVRNCLEWHQVTLSTRIAGLILLLWAQPLNKIVMLRREHAVFGVDGMTLQLGVRPTAVPEAVVDLFCGHLDSPGNPQTVNTGTPWLFPGTRAGHHLHPGTLTERLKVLGIDAQRARNATLRDLAHDVDARTLIDLLGYSKPVIARYAAHAGAPMSDYVDLKTPTPRGAATRLS